MFRFLFRRLLIVVFRIEFILMRINTGKSDDEIVMGRHGWRREGTDKVLKKRITVKIIAPAVNGSVAKVLHKNERTDEKRRINGRSSCAGVQEEEKIRSQQRVQLLEFVQSRTI
jgi:hypothetical protein